ncbi:cytochrome P450 [Hypomontagnella monticulosa]|nr:cytochrome P450 [Hypomontagnella monticulosa]
MYIIYTSIASLSPASACVVFIGLFVAWYTTSAVTAWYRLRHIPGPFLASFSYSWMIRSILFNGIQRDFAGLRKYGGIVRTGPNSVMTSDPEVLRRIASARTKYTKNEWYAAARFTPDDDTMVTLLDNKSHDTLKAKVAGGYNGRENTDLEAAVDSQVVHLIEVIRHKHLTTASKTQKVDFAYLARFFTLDVITRLSFGKPFGFLDAEDLYGYPSQVDRLFKAQNLCQEIPFLRNIMFSRFFFGLFGPKPTDESGVGKVMGITQRLIRDRFQDKKPTDDMMGSFIRHGMTEKECKNEALLVIAIRATLMYIMTTPRVYLKLKDLIKHCVDSGEVSSPVTYAQAQKLPYLQAVILEGLRMRFPTTYGHYKQVPPEGDTINGIFLPGGTAIGHNSIALSRTESIFGEDVDVFRPERFLECDDKKKVERERAIDTAFGQGRWMCAGKPVAFMELNKVFFELLRAFDFQLIYPQKAWDERTYFIPFHKNMWVRITEAA